MNLEWKDFTERKLFLLHNIPEPLKCVLIKALQQHYGELYEPEVEDTAALEDALEEILELFQGRNQTLDHIRYVWMALTLAVVVEPTVKFYQPNNSIIEETISGMTIWLIENLRRMFDSKTKFSRIIKEEYLSTFIDNFSLLPENNKEIASLQILSEALDVYSSAIKTLKYNQSLPALLDILEDCLEGYAIFPGSDGRRELFDWWLLDIVPASWYLFPPSYLYWIDELENRNNIAFNQMNKLEKISSVMWSIIWKTYQSKENPTSLRTVLKWVDNL